jgi:signal peptidase I
LAKTIALAAFLAFFCIRGFIFEPFKIPSGSMMPNLLVGDFLFVSKFAYGNRLPLTNYFFWNREPQRGDIIVFKMKGTDLPGSFFGLGDTLFIKRLVGLPGDRVAYRNKTLYINGKPMGQTMVGNYTYTAGDGREVAADIADEQLGDVRHSILLDPATPGQDVAEMVVPKEMYVMMGDNRDNSRDARYWAWPEWGFVPKHDLMGRAEFIFWSWDSHWKPRLERIGNSLRAHHEDVVGVNEKAAPAPVQTAAVAGTGEPAKAAPAAAPALLAAPADGPADGAAPVPAIPGSDAPRLPQAQ